MIGESDAVGLARLGNCLDSPPIAAIIRNERFSDEQARAAIEEGLASGAMGLHDYDAMGEGALHWAAKVGRSSLLEWLVGLGADLEAKTKWEMTPLMCACEGSFRERDGSAALELLRLGANPAAVNYNGWSVIHWAASAGLLDVCQRLVAMGVSPEEQTSGGDTPWILAHHASAAIQARDKGHWSVETLVFFDGLLDLGSRVNERGDGGRTALHLAVRKMAPEGLVCFLIERGADLNAISDKSLTPLGELCKRHFAKGWGGGESRWAQMAAQLLLAGADPSQEDAEGWSPARGAPREEGGCVPALATVRAWMEAKAIAGGIAGEVHEGKPSVGRSPGSGGVRI